MTGPESRDQTTKLLDFVAVRGDDDELVHDVSGRSLELDLFHQVDDSLKGLYVYKNNFSLVPWSIRRLHRRRTFKLIGMNN
ncbi:unnamed protein product [Linum trigynum]|uniref:Uncharacterized protein n=1 Tax=Linum trigynum TaxID=586398 RepID=A0AAV2D7W1_9ROSI